MVTEAEIHERMRGMCVVVRVKKDEGLEQKIRNEFPNISFTFLRKNEELDQHIENAEVLVAYGSVITEELIHKAKN